MPEHQHQEDEIQYWNEYRLQRLAVRRRATRQVRNTLIVVALLAGSWFLYLLYLDRNQPKLPVPSVPQVTNESETP